MTDTEQQELPLVSDPQEQQETVALGGIFGSILGIVEAALSIWKTKLQQKYIDKVETLKRAYYAEKKKPEEERSQAVLDNLTFELRITSDSLAADIRSGNK